MPAAAAVVVFATVLAAGEVAVPDDSGPASPGLWQRAREGFTVEASAVFRAGRTRLRPGGLLDPAGTLLARPDADGGADLRPDLKLAIDPILLSARPRAWGELRYQRGGGVGRGGDVFLNEWRAQVRATPWMFLSFGREVIEWGPSLFYSPTNPFFLDAGRSNPEIELGGRDVGKLVLVGGAWTASFIANLGLGRGDDYGVPFRRTHAIRLDHVASGWSGSLVASLREGGRQSLGGYGQVTASDALLLYAEAALSRHPDALYPAPTDAPVGWEMLPLEVHSGRVFPSALVGGSWTWSSGTTLAIEALHDGEGYGPQEARRYWQLASEVGPLTGAADPRAALATATLGSALRPGLRALRQNYLSAQVMRTNLADQLDVFLRGTLGLDDGSALLGSIVEWNVASRLRLFAVGAVALGRDRSEFGRALEYQATVGARVVLY